MFTQYAGVIRCMIRMASMISATLTALFSVNRFWMRCDVHSHKRVDGTWSTLGQHMSRENTGVLPHMIPLLYVLSYTAIVVHSRTGHNAVFARQSGALS